MEERSAEDIVRDLLREFVAASDPAALASISASPLDNPRGLLAAMDAWAAEHPDAATGATRAVLTPAPDDLESISFGPLLVDLVESAMAFAALGDADLDAFLQLRPPRIVRGANGTTQWAVLTPTTDREALVAAIIGPSAARPHHRAQPPRVDLHLAEGHQSAELREAYGLSLRQALEIEERPTRAQVGTLFGPLLPRAKASDARIGAGLEWLVRNKPEALLAMPLTSAITDALQGNTTPRVETALRFVHLLELPSVGYCGFLLWDTKAQLATRERSALAGHIRHLSDTAIAPWNHWRDLRTRREAFLIWTRHLGAAPLDASGLVAVLRTRYASDYASESFAKTVRRIYRVSTRMSDVRLSRELAEAARADEDHAT